MGAVPMLQVPLGVVAPLCLRFWDSVSESAIGDGLRIWGHPAGQPWRRVEGFANHSAVYILRNLPGIRDLEFGPGDETTDPADLAKNRDQYWEAYWQKAALRRRPFVLEVGDTTSRFLSFRMDAEAVWRGLFPWSGDIDGSPPDGLPVPLFSAPSRPVPGGLAVVRAQLVHRPSGRPAAWAVVEVMVPGRTRPERGIADREGRVAVIFGYPEPKGSGLTSPPGGASLLEQEWALPVHVRYAHVDPAADLPFLEEALTQPPAVAWEDDSPVSAPLSTLHLRFGEECVLRSRRAADGSRLPVLLITGGGSPP